MDEEFGRQQITFTMSGVCSEPLLQLENRNGGGLKCYQLSTCVTMDKELRRQQITSTGSAVRSKPLPQLETGMDVDLKCYQPFTDKSSYTYAIKQVISVLCILMLISHRNIIVLKSLNIYAHVFGKREIPKKLNQRYILCAGHI